MSTSIQAALTSFAALFVMLLAGAPRAVASPRSLDDLADFRKKFEQAEAIGALDEMAKLVREYEWLVILRIIVVCEAISESPNDALEKEIAGYRKAWKRGYKTDFVEKVYTYFSLLEPQIKRERPALKDRFDRATDRLRANESGEKNGPEFTLLSGEFEGLAKAFRTLGDKFYESESWIRAGTCQETSNRGPDGDLYFVTNAYRQGLAAREAIELLDKRYKETKAAFDLYEKKGYLRPPSDGEDGGGGGAPGPSAAGEAIEVPMRFEAVDDLDSYVRPNYFADDLYMIWPSVALKGNGTTAGIPGLEAAPKFVRVGAGDVRIDQDNDGKGESEGEEKIPFTGKPTVVEMTLDKGKKTERGFAVLGTIGLEKDYYQGIEVNAAPGDGWFTIYVTAAGSMVGELAGTQIRIIDDNLSGSYGDAAKDWSHIGVTKGHFQRDMDSIVVGTEKRARPWSRLQKVGDQWYEIEAVDEGTKLTATPVEVETGRLKPAFDGPKPLWVVVRGRSKPLEGMYFDLLADGSSGVELPIGQWELYEGLVREGSKREAMKALVLPDGKAGPIWEVSPGKTTKAELGGPFSFDFAVEDEGKQVKVVGASVAVLGAHGERFERIWNAPPRPEVAWRPKGSKRGTKPEKMDVVGDQFKLGELGWETAWKPLDLVLEHTSDEGVEVQLTSKKNKLFGKIASDWK